MAGSTSASAGGQGAAARAGLKFVVFTDHGDATATPEPPAYRSGVLCLDAVEISTAGGHYIALDMPTAPYPLGGEARGNLVIAAQRVQGATLLAPGFGVPGCQGHRLPGAGQGLLIAPQVAEDIGSVTERTGIGRAKFQGTVQAGEGLGRVVLGLHLLVIAFNLFGLVAIPLGAARGWTWVRIFWWRALHVGSLAVVALQAVLGRACFLTDWQDALTGGGRDRHDELQRGLVEHAMRVTVRRTRRAYVHPATHFASKLDDENFPRMGERIRLKKDFDISGFSPAVQAILQGLKRYGMLVADNGIDWAISVAPDPRIPVLHEELRKIRGSDFEVIVAPQ